jgi:MraZ protein
VGHATEVEMDSAGRIMVPPVLRSYAELDKKIMLLGQGHRFEIWSEELWNQKRDAWLAEDNEGDDGMPDQMLSLVL